MCENLIVGLILPHFTQIWTPPPKFFGGFYLYLMLDIVTSYYCLKFREKLMTQTQENGKKRWVQIWAANFFFQKSGFISH